MIILILYVDDLMITSSCLSLIRDLQALLHSEFRMMDLGDIQKFLGVDFTRTPENIFLHQSQYAKQILADFCMEDAHPTYVPMTEGLQLRKDTQTPPCDPFLYRSSTRRPASVAYYKNMLRRCPCSRQNHKQPCFPMIDPEIRN